MFIAKFLVREVLAAQLIEFAGRVAPEIVFAEVNRIRLVELGKLSHAAAQSGEWPDEAIAKANGVQHERWQQRRQNDSKKEQLAELFGDPLRQGLAWVAQQNLDAANREHRHDEEHAPMHEDAFAQGSLNVGVDVLLLPHSLVINFLVHGFPQLSRSNSKTVFERRPRGREMRIRNRSAFARQPKTVGHLQNATREQAVFFDVQRWPMRIFGQRRINRYSLGNRPSCVVQPMVKEPSRGMLTISPPGRIPDLPLEALQKRWKKSSVCSLKSHVGYERCFMSISFAIALVREQVISAEQFVELMATQAAHQIPLGTLAIRANMLTVRQVVDVLKAQEERGGRFGENAVEMGLLNRSQVDRLLAMQQSKLPCLADLLVETKVLSRSQVNALRSAHFNTSMILSSRLRPKPKFSSARSSSPQTVEF
jgi:hypothetical protein